MTETITSQINDTTQQQQSSSITNNITLISPLSTTYHESHKQKLLSLYYKQLQHTLDNAYNDRQSCIKIQSLYRGYYTRKLIKYYNQQATIIQRIYRGYSARKQYNIQCIYKQQTILQHYYNYYACVIQRYYRGYYIRKYVCNIKARHRYIEQTSKIGEQLLLKAEQYNLQSLNNMYNKQQQDKQNTINHITSNIHHLLSTKSQPGIYNHPYGTSYIDNNDSNNSMTVEESIKISFNIQQQTLKQMRYNMLQITKNNKKILSDTIKSVQSQKNYNINNNHTQRVNGHSSTMRHGRSTSSQSNKKVILPNINAHKLQYLQT